MLQFSPYLSKNFSSFKIGIVDWGFLLSIWPKHSTLHSLTVKRHMVVRYVQRLNGWRSEVSSIIRCTEWAHVQSRKHAPEAGTQSREHTEPRDQLWGAQLKNINPSFRASELSLSAVPYRLLQQLSWRSLEEGSTVIWVYPPPLPCGRSGVPKLYLQF